MDKTIVDQPNNDDQKRKDEQSKEDRKFAEGRIIIRKLSKEQRKKLLSVGASGLAGMLGGAGAFSLMSFVSEEESVNPLPPDPDPTPDPTPDPNPTPDPDPIPDPDPVVIYTEAPFAQDIDDSMSFGEAFAAARAEVGPGGIFEWHGNTYGTYYKEEWDSLSDADKTEYWDGVANATSKIEEEDVPILGENGDEKPDDYDDNIHDDYDNNNHEDNDNNIHKDDDNNDIDDEVHTITEDDFIESRDVDGDGQIDVAIVDANANDAPDLVLDTDGDGDMDVLVLDVDVETGEITGDEVIVELDEHGHYELPDDDVSDHLADNGGEVDDYTDDDLNPDIDNDMDMDDYMA